MQRYSVEYNHQSRRERRTVVDGLVASSSNSNVHVSETPTYDSVYRSLRELALLEQSRVSHTPPNYESLVDSLRSDPLLAQNSEHQAQIRSWTVLGDEDRLVDPRAVGGLGTRPFPTTPIPRVARSQTEPPAYKTPYSDSALWQARNETFSNNAISYSNFSNNLMTTPRTYLRSASTRVQELSIPSAPGAPRSLLSPNFSTMSGDNSDVITTSAKMHDAFLGTVSSVITRSTTTVQHSPAAIQIHLDPELEGPCNGNYCKVIIRLEPVMPKRLAFAEMSRQNVLSLRVHPDTSPMVDQTDPVLAFNIDTLNVEEGAPRVFGAAFLFSPTTLVQLIQDFVWIAIGHCDQKIIYTRLSEGELKRDLSQPEIKYRNTIRPPKTIIIYKEERRPEDQAPPTSQASSNQDEVLEQPVDETARLPAPLAPTREAQPLPARTRRPDSPSTESPYSDAPSRESLVDPYATTRSPSPVSDNNDNSNTSRTTHDNTNNLVQPRQQKVTYSFQPGSEPDSFVYDPIGHLIKLKLPGASCVYLEQGRSRWINFHVEVKLPENVSGIVVTDPKLVAKGVIITTQVFRARVQPAMFSLQLLSTSRLTVRVESGSNIGRINFVTVPMVDVVQEEPTPHKRPKITLRS